MITEKIKMCPQDFPIIVKNISFSSDNNIITVNGNFNVPEKIEGPIAIDITSRICGFKNTFCNHFPTYNLADYCVHLKSKYFGNNFIRKIQPKFACPLEPVG